MSESEAGIRGHGEPHRFRLFISYNGVDRPFEVQATEGVRTLLAQAIQAFGPLQNSHLLGLFTADGRELSDQQTLEEAGVKPGEHLLLRPSAVRGG